MRRRLGGKVRAGLRKFGAQVWPSLLGGVRPAVWRYRQDPNVGAVLRRCFIVGDEAAIPRPILSVLILRRLRQTIWLELRQPPNVADSSLSAVRDKDGRFAVGVRDIRYLPAVAIILDVLDSTGAALRDAATILGTTTGNLVNFLSADDRVWRSVNALRVKHRQTPLQS